jgi:hypothetical protein
MTARKSFVLVIAAAGVIAGTGALVEAQRGQGRGAMMMNDPTHLADMTLFHELLDQRQHITRTVTPRPDGVESLTESNDPAIAAKIRAHVDAMSARVKEARPIHQRDPLFQEVFKHADKIVMRAEATPKGVKVVETSSDPYTVKLIQAHAEVVSAFIANGPSEMMKNHPVPERGK